MTKGIIDNVFARPIGQHKSKSYNKTLVTAYAHKLFSQELEQLKQELKAEIKRTFREYHHLQHKELILELLIDNGEEQE